MRTCPAAVCNGALIRVVPSSTTGSQSYKERNAALAISSIDDVIAGIEVPVSEVRVSALSPALPLLPLQSAKLVANGTQTAILALTPNDVLVLHPPRWSHVRESVLSCPPTK